MLGRSEPFVVGPPRVPCLESATFLNESIILELITGRNLGPAVGRLITKTGWKRDSHNVSAECSHEEAMRTVIPNADQ